MRSKNQNGLQTEKMKLMLHSPKLFNSDKILGMVRHTVSVFLLKVGLGAVLSPVPGLFVGGPTVLRNFPGHRTCSAKTGKVPGKLG